MPYFIRASPAAPARRFEAANEAPAREVYPPGIRVVIAEPGITVTPILEKALSNLTDDGESPCGAVMRRIGMIFTGKQQNGAHRTGWPR